MKSDDEQKIRSVRRTGSKEEVSLLGAQSMTQLLEAKVGKVS